MLIKYRFSINGHAVNPIYKDDLSKDYALEPQQRFYRADLTGALKFMKNDFDWIMSQPFETEFLVLIEKSNDGGLTWTNYYTGVFFQADCQIDLDSEKIEVKLNTRDQYNEVLAGLEKEYDLLKLAPAKTPLSFDKRPLLQLYIPGDSVVSCFLGGNSWEQDVYEEITDTDALVNTYYFALASTLYKFTVSGTGTVGGVQNFLIGDYVRETGSTNYGRNNIFTLNQYVYPEEDGYGNPTGNTVYEYSLIRVSDSVEMFHGLVVNDPYNCTLDAVAGSEAVGSVDVYAFDPIKVYMRYLLDVTIISGLNTYLIPSGDIVENNRNYKRVIGYGIDCATIYNYASANPTKYGRADDGMYWQMPYTSWGAKFYPIARSTWGYSSIWFAFDTFDYILEEKGRKSYTLKDSMMISEAIRVLLNIIDPTITHDGTSAYSQFLYGTPNPITYGSFRVMITQKSNILIGEYDQPAQKAPVTLSAILAMLRDTMKVYWYIEDNKFKLEHISWFKNGGAYSGTPVTSFDLTTLIQQKNKKPWGFISSKYSYDKVDMAERYEFGWMDDVTEGFAGYPIEINSKYVQRGKIENVNISAFTSDIDYMLLNPGSISQDGFALFGAIVDPIQTIYQPAYEDRVENASITSSWTGVGFREQMTEQVTFNRIKLPIYITNSNTVATFKIAVLDSLPDPGNFVTVYEPHVVFTKQLSAPELSMTPSKSSTIKLNAPITVASGKHLVFFLAYADGTVLHYRFNTQNSGSTRHNYLFTNIANAFSSNWFETLGVDYLQVGYELFYESGNYILPYIGRTVDGAELRLQNGLMSFIYLHPNFWTYDLPSMDVTINEDDYTWVHGVERKKKQKVAFPSLDDPNPLQLINTYLGDGQIEKLSINLQSRMNDIELKYDTE